MEPKKFTIQKISLKSLFNQKRNLISIGSANILAFEKNVSHIAYTCMGGPIWHKPRVPTVFFKSVNIAFLDQKLQRNFWLCNYFSLRNKNIVHIAFGCSGPVNDISQWSHSF